MHDSALTRSLPFGTGPLYMEQRAFNWGWEWAVCLWGWSRRMLLGESHVLLQMLWLYLVNLPLFLTHHTPSPGFKYVLHLFPMKGSFIWSHGLPILSPIWSSLLANLKQIWQRGTLKVAGFFKIHHQKWCAGDRKHHSQVCLRESPVLHLHTSLHIVTKVLFQGRAIRQKQAGFYRE